MSRAYMRVTSNTMSKKILSFLLAICILISSVATGISFSDSYTESTIPMTSDAATAVDNNYQVFRQTDQNYGSYDPSGGAGCTIRKNGCGIMSIVNAVYYLNGNIISLKDLFAWALSTGGYGTDGTNRYVIYPALQAAFGAKYGFTVGTMQYGTVSDAAFISHLKNGGTAIVHVYNHFMCIAGYDSASGRYLLIDPAANWDTRHSSAGGNWMTAAELTGGINSTYLNVDWWCLLSPATASCKNYTATASVASGSGSVFFYEDVSSSKFAAGTTVFFRPIPASGYKVSSVTVNGTALTVQAGGNPSIYAFTMPSADCTVSVKFTTGGSSISNAMIIASTAYTLPASIVVRADSAQPNSYVGLFKSSTTSYSKSTAVTYYSAPAYYYEDNKSAQGATAQMQAGKRGGNYGSYNSTGSYKVLVFNTSGAVISNIAYITLSGSDSHAATLTYLPAGGTTGGGTTGGGSTTTYALIASVASGSGTVHFGNGVTTVYPTVGQVVNFQVTPASGWTTSEILVGGTAWKINNGGGDCVYQVTMPAGNCEIKVKFVQISYSTGVYEIASSDGVMSVRTKPVDGTVLAEIANGTRITALAITNTYWAKILYKGQIAYVSVYSSYAKKINSNTIAESDIVFDSSKEITWVNSAGLNSSSVALGKDPSGDTAMVVKTTAATNDPYINLNFSALGTLSATDYKYMIVTAKTSAANTAAKMYLCPGTITGASETCTTSWKWDNDGLWHDYIINLSSISTWKGNLNSIRFDFFDGDTASGATLYLRSIRFLTAAPSSPKVTTDKTSYVEGESITVNYSGLGSYNSPIQNQLPFIGLYKKGQEPGGVSTLYWASATSTSGSVKFPSGANAGAGLTSAGLTPGEYTMWIAYDGNGSASTANLNNVMYGSSGTSYNFTITKAAYSLSTSVVSGSGSAHFGGNLTSTTAAVGQQINYQTTPATGYKVSKILVNGTAQTIQNGGGDCVYQFTMPAQDTKIEVTFEKIQYAVSVGTVSNGKVTLSKTGNVDYGTTITVTATPNTGYKLNQILVNGTAISGTTFTVTAASTVTATFTATTPTAPTTSYVEKVGTGASSGSSSVFVEKGGVASDVIAELKSSLGAASVTITKDGEAVASSAKLGTGMVITADSKTYTVVIKGDVDGDGDVTQADANAVMADIYGTSKLSGAHKDAAFECSGKKSGSLSILDVMALLNAL